MLQITVVCLLPILYFLLHVCEGFFHLVVLAVAFLKLVIIMLIFYKLYINSKSSTEMLWQWKSCKF